MPFQRRAGSDRRRAREQAFTYRRGQHGATRGVTALCRWMGQRLGGHDQLQRRRRLAGAVSGDGHQLRWQLAAEPIGDERLERTGKVGLAGRVRLGAADEQQHGEGRRERGDTGER